MQLSCEPWFWVVLDEEVGGLDEMPMSMGGLHSPVKQLFPTPPSEEEEDAPNVSRVGRDVGHIPTQEHAHTHTCSYTYTLANKNRVDFCNGMCCGARAHLLRVPLPGTPDFESCQLVELF